MFGALEKEISSITTNILGCFADAENNWLDAIAPDSEIALVVKAPSNLRLSLINKLMNAYMTSSPAVKAIIDPNRLQLVQNMLSPKVKLAIAAQTVFVGVTKEGVEGEDAPAYCKRAKKTIQNLSVTLPPLLNDRMNRLAALSPEP